MTMTTMFRLRPLVLLDIAPSASPTTAKGTITQFAQPSSGMKAKNGQNQGEGTDDERGNIQHEGYVARPLRCGKSLSVHR